MPLITPNGYESFESFLPRCISDNAMMLEFPDKGQRAAVCANQFELGTGTTDNTEIQATEKSQIVCVYPFQEVWLEDYQRWHKFDEETALEIIANFQNPNVIKPIVDKKHEYGESFGDILRLFIDTREVRGETKQGLFAEIKLNPAGLELVKNRVFKGLSPVIKPYTDLEKTTHDNVLWALSLVNFQGLGTTTDDIQTQLELRKKIEETKSMKNLALELGLKTDATESEIQDKIKNLKLSLETAEEEKKKVELEKEEAEKKKVELAAETKSLNEIITAMQKQMNELFESMKTKEEAEAEKAADEAVEMGIKKGIIPTALKDVYKKRFKNDRKAFELEMSLRVPSVKIGRASCRERV